MLDFLCLSHSQNVHRIRRGLMKVAPKPVGYEVAVFRMKHHVDIRVLASAWYGFNSSIRLNALVHKVS